MVPAIASESTDHPELKAAVVELHIELIAVGIVVFVILNLNKVVAQAETKMAPGKPLHPDPR